MQPMPSKLWGWRARSSNVVDGDTIDIVIEAGFRRTGTERLRLLGVSTPERKGANRAAGDAARHFIINWPAQAEQYGGDWPLVITTHEDDAFGRYLAVVWRTCDEACLNDLLLQTGHAVPFMT